MGGGRKRLKLFYLMKILREETDEEQGLTMVQIISKLAEYDIAAERKAIYRDMEALRDFGFDIEKRGAPCEYALKNRPFKFPELLLLIDAIQSSRFLTESKSEALVESVKAFASYSQAQLLGKRVFVEGRIKMQNESVFYNVDKIQEAIMGKRKVEFQYFEYGTDKAKVLRHDAEFYVETPVYLVYLEGYYYLIAFNDAHDDFVRYRVDRMLNLRMSKCAATRNARIASFDVREFEIRSFGMFSGDTASVELKVRKEAMGAVIDRFGRDVFSSAREDGTAHVHVVVLKSPVFYGWLAQFGELIQIVKPQSLIEDYRDYLMDIVGSYKPREDES